MKHLTCVAHVSMRRIDRKLHRVTAHAVQPFSPEVAQCTLGGHTVKFYLHPSGYDKVTSEMPCAAFLMKSLADSDKKTAPKSSLEVKTEDETLTFAVASLSDVWMVHLLSGQWPRCDRIRGFVVCRLFVC